MDKYNDIKSEYESFLSFLHKTLSDEDIDEQVLYYFISAILKVWASNDLYSLDYGELISCISGTEYTIEQMVTAQSCCGYEDRELAVPIFFKKILELNDKKRLDAASEFVERLKDLLVLSAKINGDFTIEESNTVSTIISGLSNAGLSSGIKLEIDQDYQSDITPEKDESYLQNEELKKAAWERKKRKKESSSKNDLSNNEENNNENDSFTIPVTIKFSINDNEDDLNDNSNTQTIHPQEMHTVTNPDNYTNESLESLLKELDELVGLEGVKKDVHSLMNFIKVTQIREKRGMRVPTISYHLVFTGNPGTGKTTVARLVAKLYYHMGILPQGQLVEADRSSLVAGYLGQTAIKTQKVIQEAMGGVLFVDEAYSLAGETDDSYGKECIETILKAMEDHRDELVVIVAGYTELMHKFIESNPGLSSRFSKYFEFPDYTGDELLEIFNRFCSKNGYKLDNKASDKLINHFELLYKNRDEHFGNARTARNIFEKAINAQADRIALYQKISEKDLENISLDDINMAIGEAN